MIINGQTLLEYKPIKGMKKEKKRKHGVSYGLSEAGYDIRIKQTVIFGYNGEGLPLVTVVEGKFGKLIVGKFTLASTKERFQMPNNLVGVVHDKSTWARKGLSVFNTVIEPGWEGFLTLELVYHGQEPLEIPAGAGIAQVLFHEIEEPTQYDGKYQGQGNMPVQAIMEHGR